MPLPRVFNPVIHPCQAPIRWDHDADACALQFIDGSLSAQLQHHESCIIPASPPSLSSSPATGYQLACRMSHDIPMRFEICIAPMPAFAALLSANPHQKTWQCKTAQHFFHTLNRTCIMEIKVNYYRLFLRERRARFEKRHADRAPSGSTSQAHLPPPFSIRPTAPICGRGSPIAAPDGGPMPGCPLPGAWPVRCTLRAPSEGT
jgi:hypothetical protein